MPIGSPTRLATSDLLYTSKLARASSTVVPPVPPDSIDRTSPAPPVWTKAKTSALLCTSKLFRASETLSAPVPPLGIGLISVLVKSANS